MVVNKKNSGNKYIYQIYDDDTTDKMNKISHTDQQQLW